MAETSSEEDLNECHEVFASEVVESLRNSASILIDRAPLPDDSKYLTEGIFWGIVTISYLYREKNYKVFKALDASLKNENNFYRCCMFIPTERNGRFFFNFLKRVAKIYEMAAYCAKKDLNYFETARNCIAQFQHKEYFDSGGSWQRLDRIGNFLNLWSKRLRSVMAKEFCKCPSAQCETADKEVEGKIELESKDTKEGLTSDISCPIEREREHNSALVLLLADEITETKELGSIEDEIKSIMRHIASFLFPRITKHKELTEDSKNQNDSKTESRNAPKSGPSSDIPDLFYKQLAEGMASSLKEKISLQAKFKELVSFMNETKTTFQASSDSSKIEESKTSDSTILEEDLYLSNESSNEENFEQLKADKDCNENKNSSGRDVEISDKTTSESYSDSAVPAKDTTNSPDDNDYIKFLEQDLFVQASSFKPYCFSHSNSDSEGTEPYSARNSLADEGDSGAAQNNIPSPENNESLTVNIKSEHESEVKSCNRPLAIPTGSSNADSFTAKEDSDSSSETNNEVLTANKSAKSSSSEAEEKLSRISISNNAKSQQHKTKRRRKRGRSKK